MPVFKWSQTAASNGSADSTCPFPEAMAPSAVNDGVRGAMAAVAQYRDDIAGAIVTTGTNAAYLASSYSGYDTLAHLGGQMIAFSPHATNAAGPVTLSVDSLGAKPLRTAPGVELLAGTIIQGTPYAATYNNTDGAFYLHGFFGNPYSVPLLGGMDFWDTIAPNSSFIFPAGQAISRVTYASAFARWGTTYGTGDGSTTFNVPDKTGRVSAMVEASASRLTSYFGNSTIMGAAGGIDHDTLSATNMAPYTAAGTITNGAIVATLTGGNIVGASSTGVGSGGIPAPDNAVNAGISVSQAASSFSGNSNGGASTPFTNVQPTIVCNYIIRII